MIYKKNAFNNFDIIACATKYQKNELIRFQENSNNQILGLGYPLLTYLKKKNFVIEKNNYLLIAPTWIDSNNNFYQEYYYDLIKVILNSSTDVIFRPHPESFKRHKNYILDLENEFKKFDNFKIDISNNFSIVYNANYLVTDWSGISFEYMYLTKKPAIFFEIERKINNIDIKNKMDLQNQMIEVYQRDKLGFVINSPNEILQAINTVKKNSNIFSAKIDEFFASNIYNQLGSEIEIFKVILEKNKYYESKNKLI